MRELNINLTDYDYMEVTSELQRQVTNNELCDIMVALLGDMNTDQVTHIREFTTNIFKGKPMSHSMKE